MAAIITTIPPAHVLVEQNLNIVKDVLTYRIRSNPSIPGMEYDDLYQEGCICLYHAAMTFDERKARFCTYAQKVVYHGLIDYCRKVIRNQSHVAQLQVEADGTLRMEDSPLNGPDNFQVQSSTLEILELMQHSAAQYQGITKLGIEALSKKIQGATITDIASEYQVPASHVGAWICRAIRKLRKDAAFLAALK